MIIGVLLVILSLQTSAAIVQYIQAKTILLEGLESDAKNITTPLLVDIERKSHLMDQDSFDMQEFFDVHMRLAGIFSFKGLITKQDNLQEIRFIDPAGVIKAHSDQSLISKKVDTSLLDMIGKRVQSLEKNKQIHIFVPSTFKETFNGGMLLSYSNRQMEEARSRIVNDTLILLVFYILIGGLITVLLSSTITRPIKELNNVFQIIASGDLNHEINVSRKDELGGLAQSFSNMRDSIIEKIEARDQAQKESLRMQVRTVRELKRLDKLKDEFLAKTSHELRTPLHGIMGISELLFEQADSIETDRLKKELKMIYTCGKRLSTTVDDILDYSQLKNRSLTLVKKPIHIQSQVQLTIDLFVFLTKGKNIKLINEVPGDLVAEADENRLQQILQNLVGNAVKFTPEGWIVVRAVEINQQIEIEVSDSGIGIDEKQHEIIFNAFEQAEENQLTRAHEGTGLGLSITKHLVELHNGEIRVASTEGKGASFYFTLPKSNQPVSDSMHSNALLSSESTERKMLTPEREYKVLVVEDEPPVRHVIVSNLQDQYQVIEAVNGQDGWEKLKSGIIPDIILLDLMMPIMDGFALCEKIRADEQLKLIPIIILTAKSLIDDFAMALKVGANDFLRKPIGRETLLARVKNNLPINRDQITSPGGWTIYCHMDKIVFIQSSATGCTLYLEGTDQVIDIETPLAEIKDEFKEQLFSPHQNYLINTSKKACIKNRTNWDFELVFEDGKVVPISRRIYPKIKDDYEKMK
jgi:signal transduction histidine kinase/CheY-like chemotaxis protein